MPYLGQTMMEHQSLYHLAESELGIKMFYLCDWDESFGKDTNNKLWLFCNFLYPVSHWCSTLQVNTQCVVLYVQWYHKRSVPCLHLTQINMSVQTLEGNNTVFYTITYMLYMLTENQNHTPLNFKMSLLVLLVFQQNEWKASFHFYSSLTENTLPE